MVCGKDAGAHDRMFRPITIFFLIAAARERIRVERTGLPVFWGAARRAREEKIGVSLPP